ncbi:MAG: sulfotransferase domain-containing protein [Acidimicrobiia bacterium]|nr:sulfotransferase domain-containing protein [Acidimicrobiia bacterium]
MIRSPLRRYSEPDADNERWEGFEFRPGDIIISVPSKSGTTWTQLLIALLIFDGPEFPAPISDMSPWMDQKIRTRDAAHAIFAAQEHRRFIKTHTPLDGVPIGDELTYVCTGRDPRDAAISMIHHQANMRRHRIRELLAATVDEPLPEPKPESDFVESEYLDRFIDNDDPGPRWSLRFLAHHYRTFWEHRSMTNVELFHFSDFRSDLPREIKRLGAHLGLDVSPRHAAALAEEASLERARSRAGDVAPEANVELWHDNAAFFRSGSAGEWRDRMTPDQQDRYLERVSELMEPELANWVHNGPT